jgi:hypothetical protein
MNTLDLEDEFPFRSDSAERWVAAQAATPRCKDLANPLVLSSLAIHSGAKSGIFK